MNAISFSVSSLLQKGWILSTLLLQKTIAVTEQKLQVHIEKGVKIVEEMF